MLEMRLALGLGLGVTRRVSASISAPSSWDDHPIAFSLLFFFYRRLRHMYDL